MRWLRYRLLVGLDEAHDGYVMHEEDDDGGHTCYTAGEARDLAAALLAAADYAEKESKETQ